ncbi:MAG TPA: winged helix DNA-binding domain-containing protein [Acidimicrobiales bacterium]
MTERGLRRAWARAQLLGERPRTRRDVAAVAAAVGGIQAQDLTTAGLSIRARSGASRLSDVMSAVEAGEVVVTWTLRGTRHLHARDDVAWMVRLLGPVFNRPGRRAEQLGIAGRTGSRAVAALREALADGPLDRDQVRQLLAPVGVDPSGQAVVHVIGRAALEGALHVVPGRPERYAPLELEDEAGPQTGAAAAAELARRHLAGFGPATPDDFRAWSGLGAGAVREAWATIEPELAQLGTGRWVLADHLEGTRSAARRTAPPRLLGGFDALLLGRADRSALVAPEHARKVNPGGGMIKATVLVDGRVVGTWTGGRRTPVQIEPFQPFDTSALDEEAAAVSAFLRP